MIKPYDLPDVGPCVIGDKFDLYVQGKKFFKPNVVVTFEGFYRDDQDKIYFLRWEENLIARHSIPRDENSAKKASRIKWKVNLNNNEDAARHLSTLLYEVRGEGESGKRHYARSHAKITIPAIKITTDIKLTRIMLHEFAKPAGNNYVFYSAPVQAYINSLSVQQKKLLLNYKVDKPEGRLVIFISIYPINELRMGADTCYSRATVKPNATFTVFYCRGPGKDVTLVCHTKHFFLNMLNGHTSSLMRGKQGGKDANKWHSKKNSNPVKFKIACMLPERRTDGMIFCRIFTPEGKDIMLGNTMHGMINTIGCWMLFRNFNWPRSIFNPLDRIYRRLHREGRSKKAVEDELANVGYNAQASSGLSSSYDKFLLYDRNFAYLWFFHEVVGIKYFSNTWTFGGRWSYDPGRRVNDYKTHGYVLEKAFPLAEAGKNPEYNLPDEGSYAYHDREERRKLNKTFEPDNSLWRENALGFKTAQAFIPATAWRQHITEEQIKQWSWADLYFYKEDAVNMKKLPAVYTEPNRDRLRDIHW